MSNGPGAGEIKICSCYTDSSMMSSKMCRHLRKFNGMMQNHREPTQSVCVADCYFIVNVLDLPFASPIAIYR